jgi:hypothetical protein
MSIAKDATGGNVNARTAARLGWSLLALAVLFEPAHRRSQPDDPSVLATER